jgi:hypothetical protein
MLSVPLKHLWFLENIENENPACFSPLEESLRVYILLFMYTGTAVNLSNSYEEYK